jgi:dipeptidyl aminopeptidase/acylaminoacyl peptidase
MLQLSIRYVLNIGAFLILCAGKCSWAQSPGVAPSDCVKVRYITGLWVSGGGTRVAYLVKAPDLEKNRNDYRLYVKDLNDATTSEGELLFSGEDIADVKWLADDNRIALLASVENDQRILIVNAATGTIESTLKGTKSIESFSIDASGDTVTYTVSDGPRQNEEPHVGVIPKASSHRVSFDFTGSGYRSTKSLYVQHRGKSGEWSSAQLITIHNPFTHREITHLVDPMFLSLSPDGERLLLNYFADGIPEEWKKNPFIATDVNGLSRIMVLYDLKRGDTALGFRTIFPDTVPLWSPDSRSFLMNAHSPVGSSWEAEDIRDHWVSGADVNVFEVDVDSGEVSEVFRHVPPLYHHDGPLFWRRDGDVLVRSGWTSVARIHRFDSSWRKVEDIKLPGNDEDRFRVVTSNGTDILGVHETVSAPQNLFQFKPGDTQIRRLTDINPQLKALSFAPVEMVHWPTPEGLDIGGLLFMPPDYVPGRRYPLVIQTKGDQGFFACDSGITHEPSFAPQPIASAGIMYLIRTVAPEFDFQEEVDKRPKGYPGGIGEAVQQMDIWDSAVDVLDKRGLIDPSKVGIIGFSRTGWHVEFDLVHARTKYAAATATDNVQYSLGEWWLLPWVTHAEEQMYGGPPLGNTLKNWQQYSISYNFDKVHTPLLMEEMGYGVHDDLPGSVPNALGSSYEVLQSLSRLKKPAELYYYPDDNHQPDHPRARLESVQRNVDWYRFWLQGYERPNPEDPDQYERWRVLRKLYEKDIDPANSMATFPSN